MNDSARPLRIRAFGLAAAFLVAGFWCGESQGTARKGDQPKTAAHSNRPQRVLSLRHLRRLLSAKRVQASAAGIGMMMRGAATDQQGPALPAEGDQPSYSHSNTNVQVQGVDEGDLVKTDGRFLYSIQGGQIRIVRAYPPKELELLASVKLDDGLYANELYIEDDRLVVVGGGWDGAQLPGPLADVAFPWPMGNPKTVARVYDVSNRRQPVLEREVSIGGSLLASRKVGDSLYLLARTYPSFYLEAARANATAKPARATRSTALPAVADSAVGGGKSRPLPLADVYYFPGFLEADYVTVAGFRPSRPKLPADIKSFLGAGSLAYASTDNILLSAADSAAPITDGGDPVPASNLYRLSIQDGISKFQAAGKVPGGPLNQFSMDQSGNHFRIATTVSRWIQKGDTGELQNWNNLYILDSDLHISGRLEHLAEGERIFAARFLGDRCYLVTFRQIDPLFVLDLADPAAPKVLGELKIPGFSHYLHPYDDQNILGIGQDTDDSGQLQGGVRLALFDVADVTQPKLRHSLVIGSQGSYSDVFYDHRALLFDKTRDLLGFPILETAPVAGGDWPMAVFQGAQIYRISAAEGFRKLAVISHARDDNPYDWYRSVRRLLTIEDQFYTLSEARIQADDIDRHTMTGALDLPDVPSTDPVPVDPGGDPLPPSNPGDGVACTQDAQLCPDGTTWVGRVAPRCEFAPCPDPANSR